MGAGSPGCGGRSPRARGSPDCHDLQRTGHGSIPAGTGKPSSPVSAIAVERVDPRGHGEALEVLRHGPSVRGRSPRARGSQPLNPYVREDLGSIPAGTGKPPDRSRPAALGRVDPRGHGEAASCRRGHRHRKGRSPRARGSLGLFPGGATAPGSIPAGTGKPLSHPDLCSLFRVDPRGHGEANGPNGEPPAWMGRSPRARGSRQTDGGSSSGQGSIPAGTGKPG